MRDGNATVGIRLEDKSRWERRVPIVPADLELLHRDQGLQFVVQPSPTRVYGDDAYRAAGAALDDDLSPADAIFAVKEVPIPLLLPERTYCFFAHVIKGQPHNMPLLRRILELGITLVDYERITDSHGHRLVKFGLEAGQAGMIDTLWALGQRLRQRGADTPLAQVKQAYRYADLAEALRRIEDLGKAWRAGAAKDLEHPLVVGFTGRGSVSQGAQEVFDVLPHEIVEAEDLPRIVERPERDRVFKVVFDKRHLVRHRESGRTFNEAEYHQHPARFQGRLHEYLPYLTALVNGIFWTDDYPRFITREQVREQWSRGERRLEVIGDITCDIDGAIELTFKPAQPDAPTYVYQPEQDRFVDGLDAEGVCVLAVDNLPCELPRDASDQFSRALSGFVGPIARCDYRRPFAELDLPESILAAVITHRGELTPKYRYLRQYLDATG
ncbi:MAG: bifunctional lysine ketoglutarate reductase /saccharopine dehydrogenase family protein [Holophagales bacterium]|nr:bifunctional lysine ketoglutarate reductase /saccharopine dehydrogenase family protein [Holophagales bacterium]